AAAALAGGGAGTISRRQPLRTFRHHDAESLRDRVPSFERRREDVDGVPLPLQAAGSAESAGDLCAVSAALRLEPVVCLTGRVAREPHGAANGREAAGRQPRGAVSLCGEPVSIQAAAAHPGGDLAVLVQRPGDKARDRRLVEAGAAGPVRTGNRTRAGWPVRDRESAGGGEMAALTARPQN